MFRARCVSTVVDAHESSCVMSIVMCLVFRLLRVGAWAHMQCSVV